MGVSSRCWHKAAVLLRLVAAQQQQVVDAEELQVEQLVLDVLDGSPATDNVRLHGDIVSLLDGGCDGHCSRAATDSLTLELPVFQFLVNELRVMGGNVDVSRVKFPQLVDIGKQFLSACAFQGREHLKREPSALCILMDKSCYAHNWLQRYEKNTTDCTD